MDQFKTGDVVQLRSGGPQATVVNVGAKNLSMIYYNVGTGLFETFETNAGCMRFATSGPQTPEGVSSLRSTSVART